MERESQSESEHEGKSGESEEATSAHGHAGPTLMGNAAAQMGPGMMQKKLARRRAARAPGGAEVAIEPSLVDAVRSVGQGGIAQLLAANAAPAAGQEVADESHVEALANVPAAKPPAEEEHAHGAVPPLGYMNIGAKADGADDHSGIGGDPDVRYVNRLNTLFPGKLKKDHPATPPTAEVLKQTAAEAVAAFLPKKDKSGKYEKSTVVLNELSKAFVDSSLGADYEAWMVAIVKGLVAHGMKVVVCSALDKHQGMKALWRALARIHGDVYMAMETQVTGTDPDTGKGAANPIYKMLERTFKEMIGLGFDPSQLVHVVNLSSEEKNRKTGAYGQEKGRTGEFERNIEEETEAADKIGYGGVMGYGFYVSQPIATTWNKIWQKHQKEPTKG